ncbi:hypothetical protein ACFVOR_14880 [Streptomyces sp. NPDC057837]|uniref:hypothetical protein n=1 Tax=Streptomyces sp. NPDC057837 TaxID=3346260 RepID=UPI0036A33320
MSEPIDHKVRAAVLREGAAAIVAENDRMLWATKPGKHWAADVLTRMAETSDAVRGQGALPMPVGTAALTAEQRAAIADLIGDATPATAGLVERLAQSVRDRREHQHPTWEDLFCLNLVSWAGERMGPVLRRLLDAEARVAELEAHLATARTEAIADVGDWLDEHGQKDAAYLVYSVDIPAARDMKPVPDGITRRIAPTQALREDKPAEEPTLTVYRAEHESIVMGLYTTAAAAREHCEAEKRRAWPTGTALSFDWIEDEDDDVAELVVTAGQNEESTTGYVVTALEVASKYDEEADA